LPNNLNPVRAAPCHAAGCHEASSAPEPLSGLELRSFYPHAPDDLGHTRRIAELDRRDLRDSSISDVHVRVDPAWRRCPPMQIDDRRTGTSQSQDSGIRNNREDPSSPDRDRLSNRVARINGQDRAMRQYQIGRA
jgi:hypothetical protein